MPEFVGSPQRFRDGSGGSGGAICVVAVTATLLAGTPGSPVLRAVDYAGFFGIVALPLSLGSGSSSAASTTSSG